jgi:2-keto-4-pentenoate hydratase/2-oxohepta-3-ene-1,7-dioic acid hydratase in catechol pathway
MRYGRLGEQGHEIPVAWTVMHPGDLINTGTPAGVALGTPGEPHLCPGDVVELWISGLGRARRPCEAAP